MLKNGLKFQNSFYNANMIVYEFKYCYVNACILNIANTATKIQITKNQSLDMLVKQHICFRSLLLINQNKPHSNSSFSSPSTNKHHH